MIHTLQLRGMSWLQACLGNLLLLLLRGHLRFFAFLSLVLFLLLQQGGHRERGVVMVKKESVRTAGANSMLLRCRRITAQ